MMSDNAVRQTSVIPSTKQEQTAALLTAQAALQAARRDQLDVGELFSVTAIGVSTVSSTLMTAIANHVEIHGIRLNYVIGARCHFIVHAKKS